MNSSHVIVGFLVVIVIALFSGLFFLVSDEGNKRRTLRMLSIRIGLSLALILFLVVGYLMGWIKPHGLAP
ncbi:MAG: twin transmembrane helix small protein [Nevskiales bacterium]